ncbi:hypothetical protein L596_009463 [Steinernema carpocapsae]|uniref:Uncharacterized protein n=1 Tax=Steinernema carpocapsae TaxID=34508 RepID=A0A4U5PFF3_STECR|nr:hypothetical protein L596_009463 [Steinernema carpocapsae]
MGFANRHLIEELYGSKVENGDNSGYIFVKTMEPIMIPRTLDPSPDLTKKFCVFLTYSLWVLIFPGPE